MVVPLQDTERHKEAQGGKEDFGKGKVRKQDRKEGGVGCICRRNRESEK